MPPETDHDKIIRIDTTVQEIKTLLENHLRHHFLYTLTATSALISALVALIIAFARS